jgi:hypothetical protein
MSISSTKSGALVEGLAQRIRARFPPVVANDPERTVSQGRIDEILGEIFSPAVKSEGQNRVGFVGKAMLKSALKRELREIGYDEKFVDFAADKFIEQLSPRRG